MVLNQKGEGRAKFIFGLLVLLTAVYIAWKIVPVMVHVYAFEDAVKEEAKYLHGRSLDDLRGDLLRKAKAEELPITEEQIAIDKFRSEEHQELKVDVTYTVPIVTPIYTYNWDQEIHYQAPVFE